MRLNRFAVGMAGLLAGMLATPLGYADESVATADRALRYRMPAGNFVRPTDPRRAVSAPRAWYSAIPPAELLRIKALPGAADDDEGAFRKTPLAAPAPAAVVTKNCVTNGAADSLAPAGIAGAVGPTTIVVVTNSNIGVYRRNNCALISRIDLKILFNNFKIPPTESLLGPRVVYDQLSGRFFVAVVSSDSGNSDQYLYFAASIDSEGIAWNRYRRMLSRGTRKYCKAAPENVWNFMMLGVNATRLLVTANQTLSASVFLTLDKAAILLGGEVKTRCFQGAFPPNFAPPIVLDQSADAFFISTGPGSDNKVTGVKITAGIKPEKDTLSFLTTINIPNWTAPPDAVQPNGQKLDTLDGRFQAASTQIGNLLWNVHTINVKGLARWRLYKLSAATDVPLFTLTPTFARGAYSFNPSVATGSAGASRPAFVTFSRTIPAKAGKGAATIMIATGPNASPTGWAATEVQRSPGQFATFGADSCNASATGACRWGDYSATQMVPGAVGKAWGFNELAVGPGDHQWATRGAQAE